MSNTESQNINSRFFEQAKYFFLVRLLQVLITFIIFFLFSIRLSKHINGQYQAAFVLINFFSAFVFLGLPQQVLTIERSRLQAVFPWLLLKYTPIYITVTVAVGLFMLFVPGPLSFISSLLVFICICLQAMAQLAEQLILKLNRGRAFVTQNILYSLLFILLHLLWLWKELPVEWLIAGIALLNAIKLLAYYLPAAREKWIRAVAVTDKTYYEQQWKFLGLNEIINRVAANLDKFAIIYLLTAAGFSVYYNGTYELPFFGLLVTAIGNSLAVQLSEKEVSGKTVAAVFRNSMLAGACISFPLFCCFYFFADEFFSVFFRGKYADAVPLFRISIFIAILRISNFTSILQLRKKNQVIVVGSLIDILVNIITVILLYPSLGTRAFATGFILGTAVQIIFYLYHSAGALNMSVVKLVPWKRLAVAGILLFAAYYGLRKILVLKNELFLLTIVCAITALVIAGFLYFYRNRLNFGKRFISSMH
ncbi:MAG: lipopolysaccharide biosynthesis protein [Ferruginibacter sp.]